MVKLPRRIGHLLLVIPSSEHPNIELTAMFASKNQKSKLGGTTFKFVESDGGVPQKRRQVAQACESCRKRKKRCHHAEPDPRSSAVSNSVRPSPSSKSPSAIPQAVPVHSQTSFSAHQFSGSSGVETEHANASPATSNPMGKPQEQQPVEGTTQSNELQVRATICFRIQTSHTLRYIL